MRSRPQAGWRSRLTCPVLGGCALAGRMRSRPQRRMEKPPDPRPSQELEPKDLYTAKDRLLYLHVSAFPRFRARRRQVVRFHVVLDVGRMPRIQVAEATLRGGHYVVRHYYRT